MNERMKIDMWAASRLQDAFSLSKSSVADTSLSGMGIKLSQYKRRNSHVAEGTQVTHYRHGSGDADYAHRRLAIRQREE
ncbi:hypothetical protein ACTXT7_013305 [Hymenolepis weldensis]